MIASGGPFGEVTHPYWSVEPWVVLDLLQRANDPQHPQPLVSRAWSFRAVGHAPSPSRAKECTLSFGPCSELPGVDGRRVTSSDLRLGRPPLGSVATHDDEGHSPLLFREGDWTKRGQAEPRKRTSKSQRVDPHAGLAATPPTARITSARDWRGAGGFTGRAAQRDEATAGRFAQSRTNRTGHVPSECLAA